MHKNILKISLTILVIIAISLFFVLDLGQYVNLAYIKQQQHNLSNYYQDHQLWTISLFLLIYILVTALSLPAASILTLLAGALFGLALGLIIASFASTIGATLAFLMARFLARDYLQKKYPKQLTKINQGFEKEGAFYLFALRLVPLFPFFIINLLTAITPIKTWTFYWVSQLGMLAGTFVYVYAGTELIQIQSLSDIASPSLLFAFALLGLFPLISKKILNSYRNNKNKKNNAKI